MTTKPANGWTVKEAFSGGGSRFHLTPDTRTGHIFASARPHLPEPASTPI